MKKRMNVQRVERRTPRTAAEREKIRRARAQYERQRPSRDEVLASGDVPGGMLWGEFLDLSEAFRKLKKLREARGLSLADVAASSGIGKAALSRLENGVHSNPTLGTLFRYAEAIGAEIGISVRTK